MKRFPGGLGLVFVLLGALCGACEDDYDKLMDNIGPPPTRTPDAGAGMSDGGRSDGGSTDAGATDAGSPDAGNGGDASGNTGDAGDASATDANGDAAG